ncbi:MAG TPA: sigma-70 family RNA polymerase sigma factor [Longimicrobiales bacterium]|nr:sigma-70 family RNA polymerase sigma factor [Longimicrobiales bacterium]
MIRSASQWAEHLARRERGRLVEAARWELGGDQAEAEDIASDVITAVLEERFEDRFHLPARDGQAVAYALTVTRNMARTRGRATRRRASLISAHMIRDSGASTPPAAIEPKLAAAVNQALARLTPRERELAELHWMYGATTGEIARRLAISQNTVKELLRRARKKLARHLASVSESTKS